MPPDRFLPPVGPGADEDPDALRRVGDLLLAIAENTGAVVFTKDREGRYTFVNQQCLDLWRLPREEIIGRTDFDLFPPHIAEEIRSHDRRVIDTGRSITLEEETYFHGQRHVFNSSKVPLLDASGNVYALCGVATEITQQRQQAEERERANERKDEFLAVLGHELRNPIGTLQNCVEIMTMMPGSDSAERARNMLGRQLTQLTRLVDDLLDLGRVETGRFQVSRSPVDLASVVASVGQDFADRFGNLGLDFDVHLPDLSVWVDGDRARLGQAIGNLLDNAAKYTDRGGAVSLSLEAGSDVAIIRVVDTGVGFDTDDVDAMFEPFEGTGRRDGRHGLGLGLAIVREISERHDGSVEAVSPGVDRGAEFSIVIPRVEPPAAESVAEEFRRGSVVERRILIIDDNPGFLETLADVMTFWGHEVITATDGDSGLALAMERDLDFVLCDIDLGGETDGYFVARRLRADRRTQDLCIVAITGFGQDVDRERALNAGFDAHVVKPIDFGELGSLLEELDPGECRVD